MELADYRNEEQARLDGLRRELESQSRLKDLGAQEVEDLRRRADDLHREKSELAAQLDLTRRDQDRLVNGTQSLEDQVRFHQAEAADLRERMQHLAGQNQDLEQRLNRALAHLDSRSYGAIAAIQESVAARSGERGTSGSALEARARSGERRSFSPLRPAVAARASHEDMAKVELSNQRLNPAAEASA